MRITNPELIARFKSFMQRIKKDDNIAIYCDGDPDGLCATALLIKALKQKGASPKLVSAEFHGGLTLKEEHVSKLKELKINKIFFIDLVFDKSAKNSELLEPFSEVVVLDHHPTKEDLNSEKTIFIKPELFCEGINAVTYCTSKLAYDLLCDDFSLENFSWIPCVGIFGDYECDLWADFIFNVSKRFKIEMDTDPRKTKFGIAAYKLTLADAAGEKEAIVALDFVLESENISQLIEKLGKYNFVDEKLQKYFEDFEKNAEYHVGRVYFLEVKSNLWLAPYVSSMVASRKHPHDLVIVYQGDQSGKNYLIEARQSDYSRDSSKFLVEAIDGFEGASAGGHVPASGAIIKKQDFPEFKRRILSLLG